VMWVMLVVPANGQSCVPFEGAPLTRHKCDAVVTWPNVLLLPGQPYDDVRRPALSLSLRLSGLLCQYLTGHLRAW
jgi:hypothetical protein